MMKYKLNIIYATDDGYLIPTLISAASALEWASDRATLNIAILDVGITSEKWMNFERSLRDKYGTAFGLQHVMIDVTKYSSFKSYKGSIGTYARLDIPHLFPDWSWCVYVDGDTLFTDDPIKMSSVYDARYAIQGQPDCENWDFDEHGVSSKQKWFVKNGLGWDTSQYVCAGFILMNLDWFRANNGTQRCLQFLKDYPDCHNHDQDALAYVCRGHIAFIADAWGRLSRNAFLGLSPSCLHYAADAPWKLMSSRRKDYNDAHKLWFDFARRHFGFTMQELLTEPFSPSVFRKKMLVRCACKVLFPIFQLLNFPTPIGSYLRKHYCSFCEWRKILK